MNYYTRMITIQGRRRPTTYRVTERPMLDPLFDTHPIESIEELNIYVDPPRWIKVQTPSASLEAAILAELTRQYSTDFEGADETTVPYAPV
jgi:hypothetical protein